MPLEDASAKSAKLSSEADNYWFPLENQKKEELVRSSEILAQTAWQPPKIEAERLPADKAKTGDKTFGKLELSKFYPLAELDARSKAWMTYAELVNPPAELKIGPAATSKPSDKPGKPGEGNPYPYEPPYQPPSDYKPPAAPDAKTGIDTTYIIAGLAALTAGAIAFRMKWFGSDKDPVRPIVDKASAERKAEYKDGRVVARAKDGAELDWKKFDGKEFEDASGKKLALKDVQFKLELPESADKNAEKALRAELELRLRLKGDLAEQARKVSVEVDPALKEKEEKLVYREKTSGKEFEIVGTRESKIEIKDADSVRLVQPGSEDAIIYKTSAENAANALEKGLHLDKLVKTLSNESQPASAELIKLEQAVKEREAEIKGDEEKIKQEKERLAEQRKQIADAESKLAENDSKLSAENDKIGVEESKLKTQSEQLAERETKLAAESSELAERKSKLAQDQASLEEQKKQADADKSKLALEEERIKKQASEIAGKELKLAEEAAKLNSDKQVLLQEKEKLVSVREKLLSEQKIQNSEKAKLAEQSKSANEAALALAAREGTLLEKQGQQLRDQQRLVSEMKILADKLDGLSKPDGELKLIQEQLEKIGKELATRKSELDKSEEKTRNEKTQFEAERKTLTEEKIRLEAEKAKPEADKAALDERLKQIAEQEKALSEKEAALESEAKRAAEERSFLTQKEQELTEQRKLFEEDRRSLDEAKRLLAEKQQKLNQEGIDIAAEKTKLEERAKTVAAEKTALEAEKAKIGDKQSKISQDTLAQDKASQQLDADKDSLRQEKSKLASAAEKLKTEKDSLAQKQNEQAERERLAKEQADKEQAERERLAKEQADKEQAERERLAKEQADKEQTAANLDDLKKQLADSETFARLSDEARMGDALKQLTDRALQRMPEGGAEEKAEFLSKQLKAAMRKQLGLATDAELPESVRNLQIKVVESDAKAPRLVTGAAGEAPVIEVSAKMLAENPKGVLVDAYSHASGLSILDLLHQKGNESVTMRSLEPMLNNIAEKAEKIVGARSLALQNQEKPALPADKVVSDREIALDPKKPPVTTWDGESLSFSGEKFHVAAEIEKLQKDRDAKVKELEEKVAKAKEQAEASKNSEDIALHQKLEKELVSERQNLKVVSELKLAMNGERGLAAQEKARALVKTAADKAIAERLGKPGSGGASLSRAAAAAMIVTTLAFLYVASSGPAQADKYDGSFH